MLFAKKVRRQRKMVSTIPPLAFTGDDQFLLDFPNVPTDD